MNSALEFEKQNLLDTHTKGQKKGVSKKFKLIALVNILVICFFAYSAFRTSHVENKNLNSHMNHKLYNHMKSSMNSPDMAHYHHKMRILMHAGALEDFNKYDVVVEDAKQKSTDAGK